MVAVHKCVKRIYLIEDDARAAAMINEAIALEGDPSWSVQIYTNGQDALNAVALQPPHLVLLDLRLPGVDGGTIYRQLREDPRTMQVPILFISGATSHDLHMSGIDDGILLRKPVNLSILLQVLRDHLLAA